MDEKMGEDLRQYIDCTERLIIALDRTATAQGGVVGSANINVVAGGIGVLITSILASFMAGVVICLALWVFYQQKQIDDLHDYLNVVYQYAPNLNRRTLNDSHYHHLPRPACCSGTLAGTV